MSFAVIVFPGSNCDHDCFHAISYLLKKSVRYIWHRDTSIGKNEIVIVPGGFSYGDYLRAGAIAKTSPIMKSIKKHAGEGRPVIGICNDFQILTESDLLPGTLIRNNSLKFICKCGSTLSSPNKKRAPIPKPIAAGSTFKKPSPGLISILGANRLQKLAATITPPVKPSIPSKSPLFIPLKKNTSEAPKAVTIQVKREAYKAAKIGSMLLR